MSNGTQPYVPSPLRSYHPTTAVLTVNVLWFLSLGFSLTCALAATLVKQWARKYRATTDRHPIPSQRAAVRSYLYEGVIAFKVTDMVDTIPTLLHISLLLFFAGLFGFLLPVNLAIAYLALGILVVGAGFYITITALPLIHYQCPYQTPLSAGLWRVQRTIRRLWRRRQKRLYDRSAEERPSSRVQEQENTALLQGSGLYERDRNAMHWTMSCLTEDSQLEPFIEGIPGFLLSRGPRNERNRDIMLNLMRHSDIRLGVRIFNLLLTCYRGRLLGEISYEKRAMACLNAIWSLTDILLTLAPDAYWTKDFDVRTAWMIERVSSDHLRTIVHFAKCTRAVVAGKLLRDMEHCCEGLSEDRHGKTVSLRNLIQTANTLYDERKDALENLQMVIDEICSNARDELALQDSLRKLRRWLDEARFVVLIDLVSALAKSASVPTTAPRSIYQLANNLLMCPKTPESQASFVECLSTAVEQETNREFPHFMISVLFEVAASGMLAEPGVIGKVEDILNTCKLKRPLLSDDAYRVQTVLAGGPPGGNVSSRLNLENLYSMIG
jgi:hypothetical protein